MISFRSAFLGSGIATFVVTSIMAEKTALGFIPEFSIFRAWAGIAGMAETAWVGWLIHMFVGAIVGGAIFAAIYNKLPGTHAFLKGIVFGLVSWVVMMLVFMPLAGVGIFASQAGSNVVLFTLALGLIYGVVLGSVYAWDSGPVAAGTRKS